MKLRLILLLIVFACKAFSQDYYSNRLFIKVKNEYKSIYSLKEDSRFVRLFPNNKIQKVIAVSKHPQLNSTYEVILEKDEKNILNSIEALSQFKELGYVERVPIYKLFFTPNDPQYSSQWNLTKIQADLAWNLGQGCATIKVAITDDGFLLNHEDLTNQWHINTGEINGNGIDDDGNGYIDDWRGWDAGDNDNDPSAIVSVSNAWDHGTHVAGIVAAQTHNSKGIASIGYNCKLIPIKIADNTYSLSGALAGLDYAINSTNCDIINMSWGGWGSSITYQTLFNIAKTKGIICVAAAGNSSANMGGPYPSFGVYPANYNHVISVAASTTTDAKAGFSNYGSNVDVTAPGLGIISSITTNISAYGTKSGTSMAAPLVAGLCALMKCYNPLPADSIEACLKRTCDNINTQNPTYIGQLGAGRINAFQALQCLTKKPKSNFIVLDTFQCTGKSVRYEAKSLGIPTLTYNWSFPSGSPSTSTAANPVVTYSTNGYKTATLITCNSLGCDTITKNNIVNIDTPKAWLTNRKYSSYNANPVIITVNFKGNPPYNITLTDGTNNFTQSNIRANPYFFSIVPQKDTSYITISSFSDSLCVGNKFGRDTIYRITSAGGGVSNCESSFKFNGTPNNTVVKIDPQNGATWKDLYSTNGFTWECWFNLGNRTSSSITNTESIVTASDAQLCEDIGFIFNMPWSGGTGLGWAVSGQTGCSAPRGVVATTMALNANTWYHVAGVMNYSSNTMQLYVNGALVNSGTLNISLAQRMKNNVAVTIGNQDVNYNPYSGGFTPFRGMVDEVRFWNVVRTSSEIQANYKSCLPANTPNLVAYFKADEGTGTSTNSLINGNFIGTLQNAATWSTQVDSVKNCTACNNSDCDTSNFITGLLAHYKLDGNVQDASSNAQHGTAYGGLTYVAGKKGQAASFDGIDDYISVNTKILQGKSTFTIAGWVYLNSMLPALKQWNLYRENTNGWYGAGMDFTIGRLGSNTNYQFQAGWSNGSGGGMNSYVVRNTSTDTGKWYCFVLTRSNDTLKLYLDGVLLDSKFNNFLNTPLSNGILGGWFSNNDPNHSGYGKSLMDDVRFYDRAYSSSEVKGYCGTCNITPPNSDCDTTNLNTGKVLHLDFNGSTQDKSASANHATNYGAIPVAGKDGTANTAYKFNGSSDYMALANNTNLNVTTKLSISAILKVEGYFPKLPYNASSIISKGNDNVAGFFTLRFIDDVTVNNADTNTSNFYGQFTNDGLPAIYNTVVDKPPHIVKNQWYCVTYTFDGDTARLYVDGVLMYKHKTNVNSIANISQVVNIGRGLDNSPADYYFKGIIDDLRVYNRVLTPSEVKGYCGVCKIDSIKCTKPKRYTYNKCMSHSEQLSVRIGTNYQWTPTIDLSNDTIHNPICSALSSRTYLVSYLDTAGCSIVDTFDILVKKAAPYLPMPDQHICIGDSAQPNLGIYATNIIWSPNTFISNITSASPYIYPPTNATYYVRFNDSLGCLQYDTINIYTKVCCPARARFTISDSILCMGEPLLITNKSKGIINFYNWSFGNAIPNNHNGANPPTLKFPSGGLYPIRLIVGNSTCSDTMTRNIYVIDIKPFAGVDTNNCLGAFTTQLGDFPISDWTYNWSPILYLNNPTIANPICNIINDSVNYIVEATDNFSGCKGYDTVVAYTNRNILSKSSNIRICDGTNYKFHGVDYNTSGIYYKTLKKSDGICDSFIDILQLEVLKTQVITNIPKIGCEFYTDKNGKRHVSSYIERDTIRSKSIINCDSIINITPIEIYKKSYRSRTISGCAPLKYNGKTYYTSKPKIDSIITRGAYSGCDSIITTIDIVVYPKPIATITPSKVNPVLYKDTLTLSASGGGTYLWLQIYSRDSILNLTANNIDPLKFTLWVSNEYDCKDTAEYELKTKLPDTCYFGFPNAFTPNGDNLNDEFIPNLDNCAELKYFVVFDRWGEKVFETTKYEGWKGIYRNKPALMGVYIYYAEIWTPHGVRESKGSFTLVR